jgi:hypothetical protein
VQQPEQEPGGGEDDARRVGPSPRVDQALRGRLSRLGLPDQPQDALDRALGLRPQHGRNEAAAPVHCAGEQLVARALGHRDALPRQGRLVRLGRSLSHARVGRHAVAGQEEDAVARAQLRDGHLRAVDAARVGRRARHQRVDRAARAVEGVVLHRARGGEQEEQQQALERLAHRPRPRRRQQHEQVHVDPPVAAHRVPGLLRRLPAAGEAAAEDEQVEDPGRRARAEVAPGDGAEAEGPADRRLRRERPPAVLGVAVSVVAVMMG